MAPQHSEVFAGAIILLLVLIAAAIGLPPAFDHLGGEWATVLDWMRR